MEWGRIIGGYRRFIIFGLIAVLLAVAGNLFPRAPGLTFRFFLAQDLAIIVAISIAILLSPALSRLSIAPTLPTIDARRVALAAIGVLLFCYAGHRLLFKGFDLSRDEQMASFDAAILASGRLFAPMPEMWRDVGGALNRTFQLPVADHAAWVSAYLPVNAAFRGLMAKITDPALTSPLLAAVAIIALWRVTRRLWPDDRDAGAVSLTLLIISAQFLANAMTSYAMTGHLALNLVWLALFLRGDARGHAGAILIGALATGLHQPIFHPLFVAPFLLMLLIERRWPLLFLYGGTYLAIGLFWLAWPGMVSANASELARPALVHAAADAGIGGRLSALFAMMSASGPVLMLANLFRLIAWQHWLLIPLAVAGAIAQRRGHGIAFALTLGVLLHILVIGILLPYQGHGWGYRYVHGVTGNLAILAGYGWIGLRASGWDGRALMRAATLATLIAMVWQAYAIHRMVAPFAAADRAIAATKADYVLIDDGSAAFAQDLVINRPDLDPPPVRLAASVVKEHPDWRAICSGGKDVALFGSDRLAAVRAATGFEMDPTEKQFADARAVLQRAGCTILPGPLPAAATPPASRPN